MSSLPAKKTISNFKKKGFVQSEGDHHFFEYWYNGKLITRTRTSHNSQTIDDYLIMMMYKQCSMDKNFFIEFAKCTKSEDDYINLLKSKGQI